MKPLHLVFLLAPTLLSSCKVTQEKPAAAVTADRPIRLEEAQPPSIDPCALCVGFSATKPYTSGSIRWVNCRMGQDKVYLDLRLSKRNKPDLKVRLMRDCDNPAQPGNIVTVSNHYLKCSADDISGFTVVHYEQTPEGHIVTSILFNFSWSNELNVFQAKLTSNALVDIQVKDGWQMHYDNAKGCKGK
ncbi:MAG: hypothetical protein KIS77_19050 [Saprospiraceae bacterium]|nr:hypothetical protein [Saprospiraceae bacterium]